MMPAQSRGRDIMRRFLIGAAILAWAGGCSTPEAPVVSVATVDPNIAKVESSLTARSLVAGEPAPVWTLAERMAFYKVPGVSIAVIEDGKIAWAKGYGVLEAGAPKAIDTETIFQAGSISKPVAGIAALRLVEQGKLSLDAPINDALRSWKIPDNEFTAETPVTLRQILSHGAGLTVHGFPGYAAGAAVPTTQQVLDGAKPANTPAVRVNKKPGESWRYSGGGYTVMQLAMEEASGRDFVALTDELALRAMGMTRSTYLNPVPVANLGNAATAHTRAGVAVPGHSHTYPEMAAASLWSTPSDLARMGLAVVDAARGRSGAILGPDMTQHLLRTQFGTYGLGFALAEPGDGQVFSHNGSDMGFEAAFFTYTDGSGGAAIMTNGQNGGALAREILASLSATYGWKFGAPEIRAALALTPERASQFAGTYVATRAGQPDIVVQVTAEGGKLWVTAPDTEPQRLFVASDGYVFVENRPLSPYAMDATRKPVSMELVTGIHYVRRD
jgi:CubicO group peptidase (beta-lactamase class C family)